MWFFKCCTLISYNPRGGRVGLDLTGTVNYPTGSSPLGSAQELMRDVDEALGDINYRPFGLTTTPGVTVSVGGKPGVLFFFSFFY